MAKVLSSISGNLISAASAGYAPTNGADVSAIASAYQVVSATGTQTYAGTAYVTSLNSAPVSAERAGNAANAGLANSAWYDGTGRYISALPDSSTVSAIASSYAKSSVSGMSGQSSNWNSVYNTVSSNSASWSGGSQTLTSPEGTIVINGGQLEGTNSAVLTETTGDQEQVLGTTTNTIQGYQMTSLTTYMLGQTGFELYISSTTQQYGTEVLISGRTQNSTYESASGAFPANGTLVRIPLGNIISDISASANNWISMPGYEVTARLPGTVIVTGVGELAWASSVSGVSSTVYNNSANWAASGISSATCSAIASSYAESAASGKQNSGNYISAGGLNQRITGNGGQAVSFASGTNGTAAGLWISGQFSTAYYKDNELKLNRNNHMIAFNIGGQGPKISSMAASKNQHSMLYLYQYGNNSATYSEDGFTAVNSASATLLKYDTAEYTKLTSVHDTVSANSANWGGGATGDYVEKSSTDVNIGSGISVSGTSLGQGNSISAYDYSLAQGYLSQASGTSLAAGVWAIVSATSFGQGYNVYASGQSFSQGMQNQAWGTSFAQGYANKAIQTSFVQGVGNTASSLSYAVGGGLSAYNESIVFGKHNLKGDGTVDNVAFTIGDGTGSGSRHDLLNITKDGEITVYSATSDTTGFPIVSGLHDVRYTVSANSATWASASAISSYALSSDVSGIVDTVSSQSANWGGSALALSAGPGVKLEKVGNTLVAGLDETVLWSGYANATGTTYDLTETMRNFERVSFVCSVNSAGHQRASQVTEYDVTLNYSGPIYFYPECKNIAANALTSNVFYVSATDSKWALINGLQYINTTLNTGIGTYNFFVHKIVGVNRTAGA